MRREIALTKGRVTQVDAEDYTGLSVFRWHAYVRGRRAYARRVVVHEDGSRETVHMHRAVLGLTDPKILVDHINGDSLDNRRSNLRPASNQENTWNQRIRANNTSGFKGVCLHKKSGKWAAQVQGKYLGLFGTPEEAAMEYDRVAGELYGDFALVNGVVL